VGISVDDVETLKRFKAETRAPYPLLSDAGGKVSAKYVGLYPVVGLAKRANVVVDQAGKVTGIVTGNDALDPGSAIQACAAGKS